SRNNPTILSGRNRFVRKNTRTFMPTNKCEKCGAEIDGAVCSACGTTVSGLRHDSGGSQAQARKKSGRVTLVFAVLVLLGASLAAWMATSKTPKLTPNARPIPDIAEVTSKAEAGDANAQKILGASYAKGEGVPQKYAEAAKWYLKAAEQGNPEAQ